MPKLQPAQLHRVIAVHGLEDCGALIAQATPAQLSQLFDLDLWRSAQPGLDEQFDPARFGVWIDVLADAGDDVAAGKLAAMPLPQIVAGLAHHIDVFDVAAVSTYETTDGTQVDYSPPVRDRVGCEIGGYHVAARREEAWDAIVSVLAALDIHRPDRFVALMRAVRSRSHSPREADGFHSLLQNREQMMFDAAEERERRRRERGFATPAEATAFLQMSRTVKPDAVTPNPLAREYFRSVETGADESESAMVTPQDEVEAAALLAEAGAVPLQPARALLGGSTEETTRIQRCMQVASERDQAAYGERHFELAYLANVLISGCAIHARPFTPSEAADAAVAICNLGLEQLPDAPDYLVRHDLIGAFQIGWTVLHEDVCLYTARALAGVPGLGMLRVRLLREIGNGTPWRARDALFDELTMIDAPAAEALVGLIAECPTIHAALPALLDRSARGINAEAFEFISRADQLSTIRRFVAGLPSMLG